MSTPSFEQFGKYLLLEKLATGGMAEVFLARGSGAGGIGKFFAIKRILPQYADSPEFVDMFKDEAKIAINLSHSNIVSIHEFGVEKGQFFLVMDYVEGRNLRQIMNKIKKSNLQFSLDQIVYMTKEVAAGLDHAHRCIDGSTGKPLNITHRDMSPQNIMVSFEGETKVVDFGIAKAESQIETTRAGTLKGKFGYMSPEQAEGQAVDLRTDIFSLGIVLWEMLANDRLFVANNEINTLRKIRDCQIPSLRKINPNIQPELERIVQKALARDRNLRYQTAAALHRDLNRFLNRQYPDFSPQDFAVFIKSAFADEILSLRKRLVDYTKVNGRPQASQEYDDKTSLVDTNTSSLVVTASSASRSMNLEDPGGFNSGDGSPSNISISELTRTDPRSPKPQVRVLDDEAIQAEMNREISVKARVREPVGGRSPEEAEAIAKASAQAEKETVTSTSPQTPMHDPVTSPSISKITTIPAPKPFNSARPMPRPAPVAPKRKPVRMASALIFMILCVSVYSYLVKYFTPMMANVIAVTDPYIHSLHDQLGVQRVTDEASNSPAKSAPSALDPATAPGRGQQNAAQSPAPVQTAPAVEEPPKPAPTTTFMMITSSPSGAQIMVDGKPTGYLTPARVEVSVGDLTISLSKRGYEDVTQTGIKADAIGHRFAVTLKKANVGYVDVHVPSQDIPNVVIYVNGVQAQGGLKDIAVPAGTQVKLRAENRVTGNWDEATIQVSQDKRTNVTLSMKRAGSRAPSNK